MVALAALAALALAPGSSACATWARAAELTAATTRAAAVMARTLLLALATISLGPSCLCLVLIVSAPGSLLSNSTGPGLEALWSFLGTCREERAGQSTS
ncbi:MAG: hypothetical protein ABSA91_12670 [Acidimicrobiales bacterium]